MIWKGDGRVPSLTYNFNNTVTKKNCEYLIDYCLSNYEMTTARMGKDFESGKVNLEERKTKVSFIDGTSQRDKDIRSMMQNFITEANDNFFHYDIVGFEAIQFSKYEDGGHYKWHQDYFPEMMKKEYPRSRKLSVSLTLTDYNESGGHLEIFNGDAYSKDDIKQMNSLGTAVVFDSREWHRITPIKNGVRYSLVCWSQGPHFK